MYVRQYLDNRFGKNKIVALLGLPEMKDAKLYEIKE